MKLQLELGELDVIIANAVATALQDKQSSLSKWAYFTLKETAELLQIKPSTLLDRRQGFLDQLEYSQKGKIFWFKKASVEAYISSKTIKKYKR